MVATKLAADLDKPFILVKRMNYLGIDWGEKRIGLAFADELGVPVPLPAAVASQFRDRLAHIGAIITERKIDCIVVGYPYNMDGSIGFKAREVDTFIATLQKEFGLPVIRADERLTSHLVKSDHKKRKQTLNRRTGDIDSLSAVVILRDYLSETLHRE